MIVPSILGSFCNLRNNICLAEEDLRLYLLTLAPGPEYLVYLGAKTLSSFWYFAGVLTIYNAIIYTSLQSTCIKKKSYKHSTKYDNRNEGVFSLSDVTRHTSYNDKFISNSQTDHITN